MPPATDFLINLPINYIYFYLSFSPLKLRRRFMRLIPLINSYLALVIGSRVVFSTSSLVLSLLRSTIVY
jgi:hypothetical protein